MSTAEVDLVRSIFESWERGDVGSAAWADPAIEFGVHDGPAPRTVSGLAAMADAMRDFLSAWKEWSVKADAYHQLDDERVLVLQHYSAKGKTSGLTIGGAPGANLFHVRDGRVTRLVCYLERHRALDELGIDGRS